MLWPVGVQTDQGDTMSNVMYSVFCNVLNYIYLDLKKVLPRKLVAFPINIDILLQRRINSGKKMKDFINFMHIGV